MNPCCLNAKAALEMAPTVAELIAGELGGPPMLAKSNLQSSARSQKFMYSRMNRYRALEKNDEN